MRVDDTMKYIGTEFPSYTNSRVRVLGIRENGKYHVKVIGVGVAIEGDGFWGVSFTAKAEDLEVTE